MPKLTDICMMRGSNNSYNVENDSQPIHNSSAWLQL